MRMSRLFIAAAAVAVTLGAGLTVASRSDTAEAAVVWNEDFNGAAGTGVDTSKWNFDTGGSGFGNQELQYYNSGTSNVAMDGQGPPGHHGPQGQRWPQRLLERHLPVHLGPDPDRRQVHPAVRPRRGAHPGPQRLRSVAGVLDARRQQLAG